MKVIKAMMLKRVNKTQRNRQVKSSHQLDCQIQIQKMQIMATIKVGIKKQKAEGQRIHMKIRLGNNLMANRSKLNPTLRITSTQIKIVANLMIKINSTKVKKIKTRQMMNKIIKNMMIHMIMKTTIMQ